MGEADVDLCMTLDKKKKKKKTKVSRRSEIWSRASVDVRTYTEESFKVPRTETPAGVLS